MRSTFPAHFRPTADELTHLWDSALFVVDANVVLNLYRYSTETREELERALTAVREHLFIPHRAAQEFLDNRLKVTADQAGQYDKAKKTLQDLVEILRHARQHPFLPNDAMEDFAKQSAVVIEHLDDAQEQVLGRLTTDERLEFVENLFEGRTGRALAPEELEVLVAEGANRYELRIPPGFKDQGKKVDGDPHRQYGDLIIWFQILAEGEHRKVPVIFVTDDIKEDWWETQTGRTIGPLVALRQEYYERTGQDFWMYTVQSFLTHSANRRNAEVSEDVLEEVQTVGTAWRAREEDDGTIRVLHFLPISEEEMLRKIKQSEKWAETRDGFVGLSGLIHGKLGPEGYDFDSCYAAIDSLQARGTIEVYSHQGPGHQNPVRAVRVVE